MARRAGLVLRGDDSLHFIPAEVARMIVMRPEVSQLPGTKLGMALIGGEVMPVLTLGARRDELVVCELAGERIAFAGLEAEAAGFFEESAQGVSYGEKVAPELDLFSRRAAVERTLTSSRRGFVDGQ